MTSPLDPAAGNGATARPAAQPRLGAGRPHLVLVEAVTLGAPADPWLSLRALSSYSALSIRRLRDLLRDPQHPLPHYRIGGKLLIRRGEYDQWAAAYRRVGDPDVARVVDDVLASLRPSR